MPLAMGVDVAAPFLAPLLVALRAAVLGVGGVAIGIGVTVWAMKKCWGLYKGLLSDGLVRGMTWNYDGNHPGGAMNERPTGDGRDWSYESAEYDHEMNSTGPDHEQYDSSWADGRDTDHKAASSYLDQYRGKA